MKGRRDADEAGGDLGRTAVLAVLIAALLTSGVAMVAAATTIEIGPKVGDILVLPRPFPFANVFSLGDVLIGVGAALFLVWTMRRPLALTNVAGPAAAIVAGPAVATRRLLRGPRAGQRGNSA